MPLYADGYVIPVPKKNVAAYKKMAKIGAQVWKELGALEYRECVGDDLKTKMGIPYTKLAKLKAGETVFFSWIVYKSKADRNRINKAVMKHPKIIEAMAKGGPMPFEVKRMTFGGFKVAVEA